MKPYTSHVEIGKIFGDATNYARDLGQERSEVCTPAYLQERVEEIVSQNPLKFEVEVLEKEELEKKGLNLLLAVGKGARVPPRLVLLKYKGNPSVQFESDPHLVAFVGKGITFDTGGLNLKPTGSIETMYLDMGGSAAVIAAMSVLPKLEVGKNVIGVLCLAENSIGPNAYHPSSIIKSYKGLTVEIGNTDAEGRLVLADGISYVIKNYRPSVLIDLATLTGACMVALGEHAAGLFSNSDALATAVQDAGNKVAERTWPLPIYPEHKKQLSGTASDLKNIGEGRNAGASIAAAFLQEFIEPGVSWVHLDIAGPAMSSKRRGHIPVGSTGFGTQILLQWLLNTQMEEFKYNSGTEFTKQKKKKKKKKKRTMGGNHSYVC
eukprot:TRINITY_DN9717_c0_g1_i1.p1 TRINITY_DN9717_c0_g1~~TRINITY_DN9717_c0_g1_i1.p1  ORF type:complete len:378 (-),score=88.86 TRINITY_DN9717_c0_g1_i1:198-1331(-)